MIKSFPENPNVFHRKGKCIFMVRNRVLDASNVKDSDASFIVLMMNFSKG